MAASPEALDQLGVPHVAADAYVIRPDYRLVDVAHHDRLVEAELFVMDPETFALVTAAAVIERLAHRTLDIEEVEAQLGVAQTFAPRLVQGVTERLSTAQVTALLRALVAERLSIGNLTRILEQVLEFDAGSASASVQDLVEFVRRGLAGEITARYAELADDEVLHLVAVAPELELAAREVMDSGAAERIRDAAWAASGGLDLNSTRPRDESRGPRGAPAGARS